MLPNGLSRFDDAIANIHYQREKSKIPEYNFRDHPVVHNSKLFQISEYSERYNCGKESQGQNQFESNPEHSTRNVGTNLFASNVQGQQSQNRLPSGNNRAPMENHATQTGRSPLVDDQQQQRFQQGAFNVPSGNNDVRGWQGQGEIMNPNSQRNNPGQLGDVKSEALENYKGSGNPNRADSANLAYKSDNPQVKTNRNVKDSLDVLQDDFSGTNQQSFFEKYHRRPERLEFDDNYDHHKQTLEKRNAKFSKSKESPENPLNMPHVGQGSIGRSHEQLLDEVNRKHEQKYGQSRLETSGAASSTRNANPLQRNSQVGPEPSQRGGYGVQQASGYPQARPGQYNSDKDEAYALNKNHFYQN